MTEPLADRILPTALTLFGEHGYHGTSMQRLADALGVSRAAFYYHYRSKSDVLHAIAEPLVAAFQDLAARAAAGEADPLEGYLDVVFAHQRLVRFVANDPAVQADGDIGVRLRSAYDQIAGALARQVTGSDAEVRAGCALGAIGGGVINAAAPLSSRAAVLAAARAALDHDGGSPHQTPPEVSSR